MWTLVLTVMMYDGFTDSRSYKTYTTEQQCVNAIPVFVKGVSEFTNSDLYWKDRVVYTKVQCTKEVYFK